MSISDWRSDVCSSDLKSLTAYIAWADQQVANLHGIPPPPGDPNVPLIADHADLAALPLASIAADMTRLETLFSPAKSSDERTVGKECVSQCKSRWYPYHKKNKISPTQRDSPQY